MNHYLLLYKGALIDKFRKLYPTERIEISVRGMGYLYEPSNADVQMVIKSLSDSGIEVSVIEESLDYSTLNLEYTINGSQKQFYRDSIHDIVSLLVISGKTGLSLSCLILMKAIASVLCRIKKLYKLLILDLDDTLWRGTLSEDGESKIQCMLSDASSKANVEFMQFVRGLALELGVFVALCTRNAPERVKEFIDSLEEDIFPIKNYIDVIIANENPKSINIKCICESLQILPESTVFIDDNSIVRAEVRENLPEVFVPDWEALEDVVLIVLLTSVFDRSSLSNRDRARRHTYHMLHTGSAKGQMFHGFVFMAEDEKHRTAEELYAKTNQFILNPGYCEFDERTISIVYNLHLETGEDVGVCSSITYKIDDDIFFLRNWSISCRFFGIGLEECIFESIVQLSKGKVIMIEYVQSLNNTKVKEWFMMYPSLFKMVSGGASLMLRVEGMSSLISQMRSNTNLKLG